MTLDIVWLLQVARSAGDAILRIYEQPFEVEQKADASPLTQADTAANQIIVENLSSRYPDIPYISEESKLTDYALRRHWHTYWLIDPLDGTKEFVKRNGEFTVNIALVREGVPVAGVVHVPVSNTTYYAVQGEGSYRITQNGVAERIQVRPLASNEPMRIVASRSHLNADTEQYIAAQQQRYGQVELVSSGSSLKFCLIAEGRAHAYPRFAPTMEWDTAAGHIIATEAGATVSQYPSGSTLQYNKANLLNPYFLFSS